MSYMKNFRYAAGLYIAMLLTVAGVTTAQAQDLEPYRDWFGSYGYIDTTGNIVIECRYDDAREFSEGRAAVLSRGGDISGEGIFGQLSLTLKWGYIDTSGMAVIPCVYDYAGQFHAGAQVVYGTYVGVELKYGQRPAWVASRFLQFLHDVVQSGQAHTFRYITFQVNLLSQCLVGNEAGHIAVQVGGHAFHYGIAFRMYGRVV